MGSKIAKWKNHISPLKRHDFPVENIVQGKLKRELNLFDATAIDIGAIIGAGIFVVIGQVAGVAGSGILLSILLAGAIAYLTALSYAELSHRIPKEGGEYEFAYKVISHQAGFIDGFLWSASNIVAGAVVSLGFASYFSLLFPVLPAKVIAVLILALMIVVNVIGLKSSSFINKALVVAKISVLLFFILYGLGQVNMGNFSDPVESGWEAIISGAGLMFFAFAGFGRVATVAEEVKDPRKTIPRAIMIALTACTIIYFLTGFTAVGLVGTDALSASSAPIAEAITHAGGRFAVILVSVGALAATASVLLNEILGVSRITFSMARNRQLPALLTIIHPRFNTPWIAVILAGSLMAVLAWFVNMRQIIELSSFGLLGYYAITNLSAIMLKREEAGFPKLLKKSRALVGLLACLLLMAFLAISLLGGK
ncbi:MAG: amino acid permease [Candidatus Micrarchaeota archaeon]